jgi:outer membrane lipoprotein carrier protein
MRRFHRRWLVSLTMVLMAVVLPIRAGAQKQLDRNLVLRQLARTQREVEDFTADLIQEKRLSLLKENVVSHGVIQFKRPNKVLIELFNPDPSLMVVDGNFLWLYFKRERVAQRYRVGNTPMLNRYLMILDNPLTGEWAKLASIRREGDFAVLEVAPGEAEGIFSKIIFWVSTHDWLIRKLELHEKSGDLTILSYENIRVNTGIPDSHFTLDLPADVEILHPTQ